MHLLYFLLLSFLGLNACRQISKCPNPKNIVSSLKKEEKKPSGQGKKTKEEKQKPEAGKKKSNEKQPEVKKTAELDEETSNPVQQELEKSETTPTTGPALERNEETNPVQQELEKFESPPTTGPALERNEETSNPVQQELEKSETTPTTGPSLERNEETWNLVQQELKKIDFTKIDDSYVGKRSNHPFVISNEHLFKKVYDNCRNWVFTLKMFPDLIFKWNTTRQYNIIIGVTTIQQHRLSRLLIPEMKVLNIICDPQKKPRYFLAEKKYTIESDPHLQHDLYKSYYEQFPSNPSLKAQFREMFSQATHFIMATGLGDINYNNLPLFDQNKNQIKMLLVDLEQMPQRYCHNISDRYRSILTLLWMAHPDFHSDILEKASYQDNISSREFIKKLDNVRNNSIAGIRHELITEPDNLNHWCFTPVSKIAENQREELKVYGEAKKWVKDHPIAMVNHKVQEAYTSIADNASEKKFLERITRQLNLLNQHPLYYNIPLLRTIAIPNSEGNDFSLLYQKGITKPALCRFNQPGWNDRESILYF